MHSGEMHIWTYCNIETISPTPDCVRVSWKHSGKGETTPSFADHVNSFIEPRFNGRNSASYDLLKTAITIGKDGDDVVIRATNVSPLFVKQLNSIFALRGLDATTVPGDTLEISMGRHQLKLRRYRTVDGERQADKTDSQEMPVCVLFLCGMLAEKEF